jgi:hypothetical protein
MWIIPPTYFPDPFAQLGIILDGDSITAQDTGSHIQFGQQYWDIPALSNYRAGYCVRISNVAQSGEQFSAMLGNIATHIYPNITLAHSMGLKAVVSCWGGTNDILIGGVTDPNVIFTTATNYFEACKAHGADYCIGFTILPAFGRTAVQLTCALQFNLMMREQYQSIGIDRLCDVASDVNMGPQSQTTPVGSPALLPPTTGYYFDGLHPNQAGAFIISGHFAEAVLALEGSTSYLNSASVASGPIAGGTPVTLKGSGISFVTRVTLGGMPAILNSVSDSQITCTSQRSNIAGTGDIVVLGPNGTARLANVWTYV